MIRPVFLASICVALAAAARAQEPTAPPARHVVAAAPAAVSGSSGAFTFEDVRRLAQERVRHPYRAASEALPDALSNLTSEQYRNIRYRPGSSLWRGQALFEIEFFHRGYHNRQRVNVFEVGSNGVTSIAYNPGFFTFGNLAKVPRAPASLGYAGFRVHFPLQTPGYKDELLAFLGASYFRPLARNQHYGASARGLAVDTAAPGGEDFPTFTDFWLVHPRPAERVLTIYALLDSKSAAGAFQFDIRPGAMTQIEVHCTLYPRRTIGKLGMAPLTSMFLYGTDFTGRRFDDVRPQVHDSDGLMMQTGNGQWLWRPLANPRELRVNRFMDDSPRGFGLIQRERGFQQYQDLDSQYEARPSYWVQPLGAWGKGGVELVEIPSDEEIHDNVVAYWVPAEATVAGKPLTFSYLLSAFSQMGQWPPGGKVIATRSGSPASAEGTTHFGTGARRILADFGGGDLDTLKAAQPVRAEVTADNGHVEALTVTRTDSGTWRVAVVVTPRSKRPVELHCFLTLYGEILTETWVYQWNP